MSLPLLRDDIKLNLFQKRVYNTFLKKKISLMSALNKCNDILFYMYSCSQKQSF